MYISIIYLKIAIKIEVKLIFFSCLNVANISNFDKICKLSTVSMCNIFRACKFHWVAASNMQIYVAHLLFLSV